MAVLPIYRSPASQAALMAWYDRALAQVGVPCESLLVPTRAGLTHVLAAGPAGAEPVVLLHALEGNALTWASQITALAPRYRIYAVDLPGAAGRSAPQRLPYDGRSYADWLTQTLDGLGVADANFIGLALGGWLILKFAGLSPGRVRRAALLNPAGLLPVRWKYLVPVLWDVLFINDDQAWRLARKLLAPPEAPLDEAAVEQLYLSLKHLTPAFEAPALAQTQLGRLRAPTLVLVGEHEDEWDPRELLAQARAALPNLRATESVAGAGHGLPASHAEWLNARLLQFLSEKP